jgi:predicted Fe-Mo cluster-binding NifX family protein
MPDTAIPSHFFRHGATRAQVYNEGLLVYLYDEQNRQAIIELGGHEAVAMPIAPSSEKEKVLAQFSATELLVAYELRQDDSVSVDVITGQPLSKEEMKAVKGLRWHKPQVSRLRLPSGRLRIETPNSCRIDPYESPQEEGATVQVSNGEYLLTLHRVDFEAMSDSARKAYEGPGEIVTLTLIETTSVPGTKTTSALLRFPLPEKRLTWVGKYALQGDAGSCMINFWESWEFFGLNIDKQALSQWKLEPGSLLEMDAAGKKFIVVYLEKIEFNLRYLGAYKQIFGNERMTAPLAACPEVAFAGVQELKDAGIEILTCMRVKASEAVDSGQHKKWRKAKVAILPQKLQFVDRQSFGKWKFEQDRLRGEVLFRTPRYISINFDTNALQSLGTAPGDMLRLQIGERSAKLKLFENEKRFLAATKDRSPERAKEWGSLKGKFANSYGNEIQKEEVRQQMRHFLLAEMPLSGYLDSHWLDRDQKIFLVQPGVLDSGTFGLSFTHGFVADLGAEVVLERAASG